MSIINTWAFFLLPPTIDEKIGIGYESTEIVLRGEEAFYVHLILLFCSAQV